MATATDSISEARANLEKIDKEIEAAQEQIHTLQEKVENLRRTKAQDEALIRIVDMHAQGKDLTALLNPKPMARNSTQRLRDPNEPRTVREGNRAPRGNSQAIIDAAKEILEKETTLTLKDIAKYVLDKGVEVTGKDREAHVRNVGLTMQRNDNVFVKDGPNYSLV